MSCGVTSPIAFFEFEALGRDIRELWTVAQHGDLPLLELRLGENVAVHIDEHLLDDLRSAPVRRSGWPAEARRARCVG